jgi:hypothetical protein
MRELLQQVVAEIEKLPPEEQDSLAAQILAEITDERAWAARFRATTDPEWDRLAETVRREIAAGDTTALNDVFPRGDAQS